MNIKFYYEVVKEGEVEVPMSEEMEMDIVMLEANLVGKDWEERMALKEAFANKYGSYADDVLHDTIQKHIYSVESLDIVEDSIYIPLVD